MKTFLDYLLLFASTKLFYWFMVFFTFCFYAAIYYVATQIRNANLALLYLAYIAFLGFVLFPIVGFSVDFLLDMYYPPQEENLTWGVNNLNNSTLYNELSAADSENIVNEKPDDKPKSNLLKWFCFWYIFAWIWVQI